ncbi:MAG: hypothetical protein IIC13_19045, partial [SAR324 cluster bacterium]|nr:hypothetical protein [SAR324 cluster bacterium]
MKRSASPPAPSNPGHGDPANSISPEKRRRILRRLTPLWVALSGVLVGFASPHAHVPLLWIVAFVPLLLALDLTVPIYRGGWPGRRFWLPLLACVAPAGVIFAGVIGGWISNTANVYGGFSTALALLAN